MPRLEKKGRSYYLLAGTILLPVITLAVLGIFFLRQDKYLVEQEAQEKAKAVAEQLLQGSKEKISPISFPGFWTNWPPGFLFGEIAEGGQLALPPIVGELTQPHDSNLIPPDFLDLWNRAEQAEFQGQNSVQAIELWNEFQGKAAAQSNWVAVAKFRRGNLLWREQRWAEAFELLSEVAGKPSDAYLPSGAPVWPLAVLKLISTNWPNTANYSKELDLAAAVEHAVRKSSGWTEKILNKVLAKSPSNPELQKWGNVWNQHEAARRLFTLIQPQLREVFSGQGYQLFEIGDHKWLASRSGPATNLLLLQEITRTTAPELQSLISKAQEQNPYITAEVSLLNFTISSSQLPKTDVSAPKENRVLHSLAELPFSVTISLSKPELLFARQKKRAWLFGSLIAGAAVIAIAGLVTTVRALQRQEQLNEMKSNFVSSVSHELRAPIASVRLLAEGLQNQIVTAPEKRFEYYKFIVQECRRLSGLIENVLNFTRIEQGRKEYYFSPTAPEAVLDQAIKTIEPLAENRKLKIIRNIRLTEAPGGTTQNQTSRIDPMNLQEPPAPSPVGRERAGVRVLDHGEVVGDSQGLRTGMSALRFEQIHWEVEMDGLAVCQALVNLLDNAVKHSHPGGELKVSLEIGNDSCIYQIRDQGEGIAAKEHEKIFERFYRVGSELRRETEGAGIGLSIVKHIAESHGGSIEVESELRKGSVFTLKIPLKQEANHG